MHATSAPIGTITTPDPAAPATQVTFEQARSAITRNDSPETASRPWDKDRDGFVLGEGAGVMVLEEYEHAKQRGAKIYAVVVGYGLAGDAYHVTAPHPEGKGAENAMRMALKKAGMGPGDIDYVNAHGTSTMADTIELGAVERLMGDPLPRLADEAKGRYGDTFLREMRNGYFKQAHLDVLAGAGATARRSRTTRDRGTTRRAGHRHGLRRLGTALEPPCRTPAPATNSASTTPPCATANRRPAWRSAMPRSWPSPPRWTPPVCRRWRSASPPWARTRWT